MTVYLIDWSTITIAAASLTTLADLASPTMVTGIVCIFGMRASLCTQRVDQVWLREFGVVKMLKQSMENKKAKKIDEVQGNQNKNMECNFLPQNGMCLGRQKNKISKVKIHKNKKFKFVQIAETSIKSIFFLIKWNLTKIHIHICFSYKKYFLSFHWNAKVTEDFIQSGSEPRVLVNKYKELFYWRYINSR